MRVKHVITRLVVGGAQENTIASVLGLQQKTGLDVSLLSGPTYGPEGSLEPLLQEAPGTLTRIPHLVRPIHPWHDFLAYRHLVKVFAATRPDIVHTHSGKAGILGRLAASKARVPIIVHHIHGPSFGPFQGAFANRTLTAAERHAGKLTTHFVCSAAAMARIYLAAGIGRPEMYTRLFSGFRIGPFLAAEDDVALRTRLGFKSSDFIIGKVGRLAPLKGHHDLLEAFARLVPDAPNAKLLFVGDGTLRQDIEARIRRLNLGGRVYLTGLVPPEQVPQFIGIMDCLAHLSYREALSRALPQALAAGKPVIAYDFDGADEVCLEGETGFLIETGNVARVTKSLLHLANDADLRRRLGQRGRNLVREEFSVDHMVDKLHKLYLSLAREHGLSAA